MDSYKPWQVINGTFGEAWINSDYLSEVTGVEAKIKLEQQEVNQVGTLAKGYKTTGIDCTGTIKLNKVNSYFIKMMSNNLKKGKTTECTIITNLADPDALGSERIKLIGCQLNEIALAAWEAKKLGEESIPFTFSDWELLDVI